jgi:hypothetical protein
MTGIRYYDKSPVSSFVTDSGLPLHSFPSRLLSLGLPDRLWEVILGKSPLRLVYARTQIFKGCWQETLECGHQLTTYLEFIWDEKSHLVSWEPNAKRRRCQKCKEAASVPCPILARRKALLGPNGVNEIAQNSLHSPCGVERVGDAVISIPKKPPGSVPRKRRDKTA